MIDANPVSTPMDHNAKLQICEDSDQEAFPYRELFGKLMYLAVCTRPDISFAVSYLCQFNTCFNSTHWTAAKRVLRYLKGTSDLDLVFKGSEKPLEDFVDAD